MAEVCRHFDEGWEHGSSVDGAALHDLSVVCKCSLNKQVCIIRSMQQKHRLHLAIDLCLQNTMSLGSVRIWCCIIQLYRGLLIQTPILLVVCLQNVSKKLNE